MLSDVSHMLKYSSNGGHDVGETCPTTGRVQRQDNQIEDLHGWPVEGLEHDRCHLLPVGLRVEGPLVGQSGLLGTTRSYY